MSRVVYENESFHASAEDTHFLRSTLGGNVEHDGTSLRITRVAGHLRLPGGAPLVIRSRKADAASLFSWLAYADPALTALRTLGPLPKQAGEMDFGSLVARVFCLETWRAVQTTGRLRAYHRERVHSPAIRGRIDFSRLSRMGGNLSKVPCIVFTRLPPTPLNSLLSAATRAVERDHLLRSAAGPTHPPLLALFADVPPAVDVNTLSGQRALSRLEQPFEASAALARLLLRSASLDQGQHHESLSFLINLADLFERAVARALHDSPLPVTIKRPVHITRERPDGTRNLATTMELDAFLPNVDGEPVVVDAKYKTHVSAANLQQVATYCWLTGARRAVLVFPGGQIADRRPYLLPAAYDPAQTIRIDLAELDITPRALAGWHDSARALVAAITATERAAA